MRDAFAALGIRRLRLLLAALFVALAVPTAALVYQAYTRLAWETFHQQQQTAAELAVRIDTRLAELVAAESARPFTAYAFLTVAGDPASNFVQRSPLAAYPPDSALPGVIGYFQVDAAGAFSSPLLPPADQDAAALGLAPTELEERQALASRLEHVLAANRLLRAPAMPARPPVATREEAGKAAAPAIGSYDAVEATKPSVAAARQQNAPQAKLELRMSRAQDAEAPGQAQFDALNAMREAGASRDKKTTAFAHQAMEAKAKVAGAAGAPAAPAPPADAEARDDLAAPAESRPAMPAAPAPEAAKRNLRKELSALPEPAVPLQAEAVGGAIEKDRAANVQSAVRIRTFESEVDAFEFARLDSGHFVLFRKVWRDNQRYVQGLLIEAGPFLEATVGTPYRATALLGSNALEVTFRGVRVATFAGQSGRGGYSSGEETLAGTRLYETRLSAPMSDLALAFDIRRLPSGPGGTVVAWLGAVLALVLCGGFLLLYRLAKRQIELARQQQDFISAVSHELKTPLTSIRMYGEMLREGWVAEDKRREYYGFIHDEAERLSRLINNVLQLARMTRSELEVELRPSAVGALVEMLEKKLASAAAQAGAALELSSAPELAAVTVDVDPDCFVQIMINLVDNALKFSAKTGTPRVEVAARRVRDGIAFSVRDHGPGIPRDQLAKIFRLFYRAENELTRETVGTGIGLALVKQLAEAMSGRVDAQNREPGAEFTVTFPVGRTT